MTPTPEPATRQSLKGMYIVLIVSVVLAFGVNLFNYARKPTPWSEAVPLPLILVGLMLAAWSGLLPAAKTGTRRILIGLGLVCAAVGMVLEILFRL
jgi:hypothetical protein